MARRLAVVVLLAAACSDTQTVTVPAADTTAPLVIYASPDGGAKGVAFNARVSATFSEEMDRASLESSFSLVGPAGAVAGSAAVSLDARSVTFTPADPLDPDSLYTASIATSAKDAAGNGLSAAASWTFRTGLAADSTPPRVATVSPLPGSFAAAASNPSVTAMFDEPIDCAALPPSAVALYEQDVAVAGYVDCHGDTVEFVPFPALPTHTSLVAIVSPLVVDAAGNSLGAAKIWGFDVRPWTRQLGSAADEYGGRLAIHDTDLFVLGNTRGDLDGNTSAGGADLFLAKYEASGAKQWTRQLGSAADDFGASVAIDGAGNIFVAGFTEGDLDGNASAGGTDLFVVKYDASGAKQWTRQLGSAADDLARSVATDRAGNVFVAGYTGGDLDSNTSAGDIDLFLMKFDSSGAKQWTRQLGSAGKDLGNSIALDPSGNIFVAGSTTGSLDGNMLAGSSDVFVAKYDPSGAKQWTRQLGSKTSDVATAVATDAAGGIFVTGYGGGLDGTETAGGWDAFLVKYDTSGAKQWTRQLGSTSNDGANAVVTDASGNVFVAGFTQGLDGNTFAGGLNDLFLAKFDLSGARQWTRQLGSAGDDRAASVATDPAGNLFVAGVTAGDLDGNTFVGGMYDIFLAKYGTDGRKR